MRRALALIVAGLWCAALWFPSLGICGDRSVRWFDNSTVAVFGWGGVLYGEFGWFANIFLGRACYGLLRGRDPGIPAGLCGLLLGCSVLAPVKLPHDEASTERLCAFGSGFWLWLCSLAILVLGTVALAMLESAAPGFLREFRSGQGRGGDGR